MEFEILQDLVKVITPDKLKRVEVLGNEETIGTPLSNLYKGMSEGRFSSDDDAAIALYGQGGSKNEYRKLRVRLIRQLINASFFVDVDRPIFNERQKIFYNCYRNFAVANIVAAHGAYKTSTYFLRGVLQSGVFYEFTELNAEIDYILRIRHLFENIAEGNTEKMPVIHRNYEEKRQIEIEILNHYELLIHHYAGGRSASKEVQEYAEKHYPHLLEQANSADTTISYFYTYSIGLIRHLACNDFKNALIMCEEALDFLRARGGGN